MTKVMVKTFFGSYVGESIQLYFAGPYATPMLIVRMADGSHRTTRVVDAVDLGPGPQPVTLQPQFAPPPPSPTQPGPQEHGEGGA